MTYADVLQVESRLLKITGNCVERLFSRINSSVRIQLHSSVGYLKSIAGLFPPKRTISSVQFRYIILLHFYEARNRTYALLLRICEVGKNCTTLELYCNGVSGRIQNSFAPSFPSIFRQACIADRLSCSYW